MVENMQWLKVTSATHFHIHRVVAQFSICCREPLFLNYASGYSALTITQILPIGILSASQRSRGTRHGHLGNEDSHEESKAPALEVHVPV